MTTHTPLRCARSSMVQRGVNEVVLMDTGAYPSYSNFLNETWTWNGTDWTNTATSLIDAAGPLPGRIDMGMAYDGYNVVLYGGQGASATEGNFQDTWIWNGTVWAKQTPATIPFGRYQHEMCRLNSTSIHVVMFGGYGGMGYLNETWDWNGNTKVWALQSPATSPSARIGHVMSGGATYAVMFGGSISSGEFKNDTWKWDGTTWTNLAPATSPSVRAGACMAYDVTHTKWVLFGGVNEYNYLPETWTFDGTTWTQAAPATSPSGRKNAQMCWDAQSGKVLMFGGQNATDSYPSNETWSWDSTTWTKL